MRSKSYAILAEYEHGSDNLMETVYGYYCRKIYSEAERLYNDLHSGKSVDEDLFIEQSNDNSLIGKIYLGLVK